MINMITKNKLWYLTLFSIIVVLAVYYVTFPTTKSVTVAKDNSKDKEVTIVKTTQLAAMKASRDEEHEKQVSEVKEILNNDKKTVEEKNDAYEALKQLNSTKSLEESLEKQIKKDFNKDAFVKIDNKKIKCIINSKDKSYKLANQIISSIQSKFDEPKYITVTFEEN